MNQYKGYQAAYHYSDDDGVFVGKVLGIRDVILFEADSVKGLEKEFKIAVDDYLKDCKERKREPNKPCNGRVLLRLKPDQHRALLVQAERQGKSLNDLLVEKLVGTER